MNDESSRAGKIFFCPAFPAREGAASLHNSLAFTLTPYRVVACGLFRRQVNRTGILSAARYSFSPPTV